MRTGDGSSILITGESGTGKELVARALMSAPWRGNVRELVNVLERAVSGSTLRRCTGG